MAQAKYPQKLRVTNTGKRTRTRGGFRFPGRRGGSRPRRVEIEVLSFRQHHQIAGCRDLQIAGPARAPAARPQTDE